MRTVPGDYIERWDISPMAGVACVFIFSGPVLDTRTRRGPSQPTYRHGNMVITQKDPQRASETRQYHDQFQQVD